MAYPALSQASNQIATLLQKQALLILDGGLATELERRGADLNHELWSALVLLNDPQSIVDVHLGFLNAGADIITTASYQASIGGFKRAGFDQRAGLKILRMSVDLACEAREAFIDQADSGIRLRPLIAASIGPYGASLADGSEYRGDYGLSRQQLIDFHRPRMEALAETEADLFAFETIPSRLEAEALLELLSEFPGRAAWLSFSCRDRSRVCHGEQFSQCAAIADQHGQIVAVGVNCTDPSYVSALLNSASGISTPLIAYPNSGESWDQESRCWKGERSGLQDAAQWVEAGARLVGGCCRVSVEDITRIRKTLLPA